MLRRTTNSHHSAVDGQFDGQRNSLPRFKLLALLKLLALERDQSADNATKAEQWRLRSLELSKQDPHVTKLLKALTSEEEVNEALQATQRVLADNLPSWLDR